MLNANTHVVTIQPPSLDSMDFYRDCHLPHYEKCPEPLLDPRQHFSECECERKSNGPAHKSCHNSRLRRFLVPALVAFLTLSAVLAVMCLTDLDMFGLGENGLGLVRRATDSGTGTSNGGTFVNHKYYLIVIFVGLLLVIIFAVMLSAWCCKGAFENPLCCPCYLCACCGGLACLECIGCGLCAAGVEEM